MSSTFNLKDKRSFPSKILLLGEYGILTGSAAVATPFPLFSGKLCLSSKDENLNETELMRKSNTELHTLYNFLRLPKNQIDFLNFDKLKHDLDSGLWFNSDIRQNYGIGSSGALTAALFNCYAAEEIKNLPLPEIRKKLAAIEKFFHKTSSGIDPLVSLLNKSLHIDSNGEITPVEQKIIPPFNKHGKTEKPAFSVFLVDSKAAVSTGGLVEWYLNAYKNANFKQATDAIYIPAINDAVQALLSADHSTFLTAVFAISQFQKQFLTPMLFSPFKKHIDNGLETGDFYLKLCGSGGGGYMLGFTQNETRVQEYFSQNQLEILFFEG